MELCNRIKFTGQVEAALQAWRVSASLHQVLVDVKAARQAIIIKTRSEEAKRDKALARQYKMLVTIYQEQIGKRYGKRSSEGAHQHRDGVLTAVGR